MTSFLHKVQAQWPLFPKKKALSAMLFIVLAVSGAFIALDKRPESNLQNESTKALALQLNTLQTQLKSVQDGVDRAVLPLENLNAITEHINLLSKELMNLREQNSEELNKTLTHTQASLESKINSINDAVSRLDKKAPIQYLTAENLPFKVMSIDSIQQVPVASMAYDFKTIPLEKGDSLAGWKVLAIDYSKQSIELVNAKKEHVLIKQASIG
jgi:hypothetical protein